ncbi:hypothetical protein B0H14DRAFT_3873634 [Mycena olivaceomarginata]|nr:hypothetical protein B0H14DRAFT_3873634 [Mycena olivaceomarginata]
MSLVQQNGDSPQENGVSIAHTPRNYQAYPGSKYALPHDDVERQRQVLNICSRDSLFEDRILLAPASLDRSDKVLEIGTGPGLWIMELATTIDSSVPMVGVDIEPRLFPVSPPKNIEFRVESVLNLPAEWTDTFSLVHQRLLILALQVPQWPTAIQEIHRLSRKAMHGKLTSIYRRLAEHRNLYVDCAYDIPKMLAEAGFVEIRSESRMQLMGKWAGDIGVANATNHVGVLRGIKTPVLEAGGFGYVTSEAEYDKLLAGLEKEWDEIPGSDKDFIITWARKPVA